MQAGNYTRIGETTVFYVSKQDGRMDVTQPRVTSERAVEGSERPWMDTRIDGDRS